MSRLQLWEGVVRELPVSGETVPPCGTSEREAFMKGLCENV